MDIQNNTITIITDRLILRKFTEQDIEETREFYQERYANKYMQLHGYSYAICLKVITFLLDISKLTWKKITISATDYVRNFGTKE